MEHVLVALRAHPDLAKLDFEDGVARQFTADRLAVPSSITRIMVDLRAEDQGESSPDVDGIDALLWMSAHDAADLGPGRIRQQLEPLATDIAGWTVDSRVVRPVEVTWPGTATPGTKVTIMLRRAANGSVDSFAEAVDQVVDAANDRMLTGGCARHLITGELFRAPMLDAVITLWFPTTARVDEARSLGVFEPIEQSDAFEATATRSLLVFEHRLHPNPNAWFDAPDSRLAAEV
jgi:hypothetical protein